MNLLQETVNLLRSVGKTEKQVSWVGIRNTNQTMTWLQFSKMAKDINYEPHYEEFFIHRHLIVVGADWWLERETPGLERWCFNQKPVKPKVKEKVTSLVTAFMEQDYIDTKLHTV